MSRSQPTPDPARQLALAAQAGSSAAFGDLVLRFQGPLRHFLRLRCRSATDAEEITQAAFVRAWEQLARYDARFSFSTWLYTLARREAASFHRRAERHPSGVADLDPIAPETAGHEAEPGAPGRGQLWELAARLLSRHQFDALWLRYAEDLTPAEIGRALGRPATAVRVLLHRARRTLARHLDAPPAPRSPALRGAPALPAADEFVPGGFWPPLSQPIRGT